MDARGPPVECWRVSAAAERGVADVQAKSEIGPSTRSRKAWFAYIMVGRYKEGILFWLGEVLIRRERDNYSVSE